MYYQPWQFKTFHDLFAHVSIKLPLLSFKPCPLPGFLLSNDIYCGSLRHSMIFLLMIELLYSSSFPKFCQYCYICYSSRGMPIWLRLLESFFSQFELPFTMFWPFCLIRSVAQPECTYGTPWVWPPSPPWVWGISYSFAAEVAMGLPPLQHIYPFIDRFVMTVLHLNLNVQVHEFNDFDDFGSLYNASWGHISALVTQHATLLLIPAGMLLSAPSDASIWIV